METMARTNVFNSSANIEEKYMAKKKLGLHGHEKCRIV